MGANLAGMQAAMGNLRFGQGTQVNIDWAVPRRADVQWLAANGYTLNRLPIQWEMLQPVLFDTNINTATRAIVGNPGEFNATYQSYITSMLDVHAQLGIKCWIDLHNYCRYVDFVVQPDGSVRGLVRPSAAGIYAYTSDPTQVVTRIFATAPGATLRPAHFTDFWTRAARLWKDHPGFGGYGLMNEPYNMPAAGSIVESGADGVQDLNIWPTFAKAAVDAIRAIDPTTPIYLDSNYWSAAFTLGTNNPAWPIQGSNIIYDVHMYLDAFSTGQRFDYDVELSRNASVGIGDVPINADTGWLRLKSAIDFAAPRGMKLALGETGMPIDDPRWQEMFQRLVDYARQNGVEITPWNGGSHWPLHNSSMHFVPGWHQDRTLEPAASGVLKKTANVAMATVFDDGPGYALAGTPITIAIYARGYVASPVTVTIASNNGGTLGASTVTLPAGANPQVTYTFTPAADRVTTLTYTVSGGLNAPPPRKVYSLVDPVAYASTSLAEAARAIVAKYAACKWEMADGYTDYLGQGSLAQAGQAVRAISDSGYGSSAGNAMEMLNWMNTDSASLANMPPPVMRVINGKRCTDHTGWATSGFWCRKSAPIDVMQPHPRNVVPYTSGDPHFVLASVSLNTPQDGVVFQASNAYTRALSQVSIAGGRPQATLTDYSGHTVTLTAGAALASGAASVVTLTGAVGAQRLRVNSTQAATGSTLIEQSAFDQMLIGGGFSMFYPQPGFGGNVFGVIAGKGSPSESELQVMERYLMSLAG